MSNRDYEDLGKRLGDWISRTQKSDGEENSQFEASRILAAARKRRMKRARNVAPQGFGWTPIVATGVAVGFAMLVVFLFPMFAPPKDSEIVQDSPKTGIDSPVAHKKETAKRVLVAQNDAATTPPPQQGTDHAQKTERKQRVSVPKALQKKGKQPKPVRAIVETNLIERIAKLEDKKAASAPKIASAQKQSPEKSEQESSAPNEQWEDNLTVKVKRNGCSEKMCNELRENFTSKPSAKDRRARELLLECLIRMDRKDEYGMEKDRFVRKYEENM